MTRSRIGWSDWRTSACVAALVVLTCGAASSGWAAAPPGRYAVTAATVRDTETGLTWQRTVAARTYTWASAKEYCTGLSLDGEGWRLPTATELESLHDVRRASPAMDTGAFPSAPAERFWSSSLRAGTASNAWTVDFVTGASNFDGVSNTYRARCVRRD